MQLLRLRPALEGQEVVFATVSRSYQTDVPGERLEVVNDATRWSKLALFRTALQVIWILIRVRPDVVISTGAAPGFFAVRLGKLLGAKTIWVDSIANIEQVSMAGEWAGRHADLFLTQWEHLARPDGPRYEGGVL